MWETREWKDVTKLTNSHHSLIHSKTSIVGQMLCNVQEQRRVRQGPGLSKASVCLKRWLIVIVLVSTVRVKGCNRGAMAALTRCLTLPEMAGKDVGRLVGIHQTKKKNWGGMAHANLQSCAKRWHL